MPETTTPAAPPSKKKQLLDRAVVLLSWAMMVLGTLAETTDVLKAALPANPWITRGAAILAAVILFARKIGQVLVKADLQVDADETPMQLEEARQIIDGDRK